MSTVKKTETKKTTENLPKAPKEKRPGKPWAQKRQDNAMRALRALTSLNDRFSAGTRTEHRPDFASDVGDAGRLIRQAHKDIEAAVKVLVKLTEAKYKPESEKAKLEAGAEVWIKPSVWVRKYHGLYTPEEMAGLTVKAVAAKVARARTASGIEIAEPVGAFRTRPVDYAKAVEEAEAAA